MKMLASGMEWNGEFRRYFCLNYCRRNYEDEGECRVYSQYAQIFSPNSPTLFYNMATLSNIKRNVLSAGIL
jgi:hypothetical protein